MGAGPKDAAMIGDDIMTDVGGAQRLGMKGILVKTGKYREDLANRSRGHPGPVLESIADMARYL
jgi:ribonucleotide monophosphatase NagD (HAD superfamily)